MNDNDKDSKDNESDREGKKKDRRIYIKILESKQYHMENKNGIVLLLDESDIETVNTTQLLAESVTTIRKNKIINSVKDFEIKEKLYDIKVVIIQVLEAMVEKLVFYLVKEQEEWKSIIKEIRLKNIVKIEYMIKKIAKQTKSNEELVKTNSNLKDHI